MTERFKSFGSGGRTSSWAPWVFIAPYLALAVVFLLYPFGYAIWLAFHQTNGPQSAVYVGWSNFKFVLSDPRFFIAVKNTTFYALASVFIQLPLSLGLAMLLHRDNTRLKGVFRLLVFSPHLVGSIFVGVIFSVIFTPRYGLFNRFLQALIGWGLEEQWLMNPRLIMPAVIITALWMYVGFNMIYFLAALQNVNRELVEAAQMDGANAWQMFRNVTLPQIKPVAVFVVVMSTIGSYQLFELPYVLLGSSYGVQDTGLTIVGYLYQAAFDIGDLGTGAAVGWVLALIIFTLSTAQVRLTKALED